MKTFNEFMNQGADNNDPYWSLFKINNQVNDAVLAAVEYGYNQGQNSAKKRITELEYENFSLKTANQSLENKPQKPGNEFVITTITIKDEHGMAMSKIWEMARSIAEEQINLIEEHIPSWVIQHVKTSKDSSGNDTYQYLVLKTEIY